MIRRQRIAAWVGGGHPRRGRANGKGVFDGNAFARGIGEHRFINLTGEKGEARDELNLTRNGFYFPQQRLAALGAHHQMAVAVCHHCVGLEVQGGLRQATAGCPQGKQKHNERRSVHSPVKGSSAVAASFFRSYPR